MAEQPTITGPDLALGLPVTQLRPGEKLLGHVGDQPVLLARLADEYVAIGATCTHYGGPLADGVIVGDTVRCPWHHACFSLRTGEALRAPALSPVPRWQVERRGEQLVVSRKIERDPLAPLPEPGKAPAAGHPGQIVIVGA